MRSLAALAVGLKGPLHDILQNFARPCGPAWADPEKRKSIAPHPPAVNAARARGNPHPRNRIRAVRRRDHSVLSGASSIPVDTDSISRAARAPTPMACGFAPSRTGNAHETRWQLVFVSATGQKSARLRLLTRMSDVPHLDRASCA